MTNISPLGQNSLPLDSGAPPGNGGGKTADAGSNAASAAPQSEAVTISQAAQTTTQLLNAARGASGVDQAAVQQIRTALQNGSYNVAPEDLAQAIATVLKESA
jgi:flagellar biosynthesis anti-sigma factor FlgM